MNILLITPPLTQLNTPYPATPTLKGFLKTYGHNVNQCDLGIELVNTVFTSGFLTKIFSEATVGYANKKIPANLRKILNNQEFYLQTIEPVMRFLRNEDPTLATRICNTNFLPHGHRFKDTEDTEWAFGTLGITEKAKYLATLYIEDLTDFIRETICPNFELFRYGEKLCHYLPELDPLETELKKPSNIVDRSMLSTLDLKIKAWDPQIIAITIPFPGNLYGALKCGQLIKMAYPNIKVIFGGGYVNTELRSLNEPRIFNYCDAVVLDDGEPALLRLIDYFKDLDIKENLVKTFLPDSGNSLKLWGENNEFNIPFAERGTPDYSDLPLQKYLSMIEITNPMHKLWSDGRWNKLTLAHGCYWAKCAFCDTTLPYISGYDPAPAAITAAKMKSIIKQTGQTGFHFTDEAAPPKILRELSEEIINRKLTVSWWTNIRFEKAFTSELSFQMARAGCIAVSGGIEVASDRVLKLINKGVTVEQAALAAANLTQNGIMVHAYLMYGFPTETLQETIDSLEIVRQFFNEGLIQSAFWHRYAMTVHSPSGHRPEKFGAQILNYKKGKFANNEIPFTDNQQMDLEMLGEGLHKATYNFMHGLCLDWPVKKWFTAKVPETSIPKKYISNIINTGIGQ